MPLGVEATALNFASMTSGFLEADLSLGRAAALRAMMKSACSSVVLASHCLREVNLEVLK